MMENSLQRGSSTGLRSPALLTSASRVSDDDLAPSPSRRQTRSDQPAAPAAEEAAVGLQQAEARPPSPFVGVEIEEAGRSQGSACERSKGSTGSRGVPSRSASRKDSSGLRVRWMRKSGLGGEPLGLLDVPIEPEASLGSAELAFPSAEHTVGSEALLRASECLPGQPKTPAHIVPGLWIDVAAYRMGEFRWVTF